MNDEYRHYDYTGDDNKTTYTTGSTPDGDQSAGRTPYYSRPTGSYGTQSDSYKSGTESMTQAEATTYGKDKSRKGNKTGRFVGKVFGALGLGAVFGLAAGAVIFLINRNTPIARNEAFDAANAVEETYTPALPNGKQGGRESGKSGDIDMVPIEHEYDVGDVADIGGVIVTDVSDMVEDAMPSIVSITGKYIITGQSFWGQTYSQETEGSGSGIIIGQDDNKLYIATNNHVVEDSEGLQVQFIDGSSAEAIIKGTDADVDLAVIIVDIEDLDADTRSAIKVANLGNSDEIKIGEAAVVIGNSLGYGQTVTYGVISAVDRTLEMDDGTVSKGLIQTDAAINPGNSGGALLNIRGEVIGISSSKIGGSTIDGVGFAIPITSAQPILSDIVTSVERTKVSESKQGYLGIGGQTVTDEVSNMYGLPVGVLVRQVYAGTGAEEGGLQQGDVITAINGKKIASMEDLKGELQYYSRDEVIQVTVSRMSDGLYSDVTLDIRLVDKNALE